MKWCELLKIFANTEDSDEDGNNQLFDIGDFQGYIGSRMK